MASGPNPHSTLLWRKSSASADGGNCVEVAKSEASVLVKDSADQLGTILEFSTNHWRKFVRRIKDGNSSG
jgi:hypothetical protein